jgi:hypothetical protein
VLPSNLLLKIAVTWPPQPEKGARRTNIWAIINSYNHYLAVAARVVRRSLKEDKRLAAERRGEMDLRFAKWNVSNTCDSALVVQ